MSPGEANRPGISEAYHHQPASPYRPLTPSPPEGISPSPFNCSLYRRPIDFLLEDVRQSRKPFIYHGRDIVKENARTVRFQRPPKAPQRQVPPFSLQVSQKNVAVQPPKSIMKRSRSAEAQVLGWSLQDQKMQSEDTQKFAILYNRGDLPVVLEHKGGSGEPPRALRWSRAPRHLSDEELSMLFQKFSLGLDALQQPLRNVAEWGVSDLLEAVSSAEPVLDSLPQLVKDLL